MLASLAFFTTLKLIMVSIDFDNFRNVAAVSNDAMLVMEERGNEAMRTPNAANVRLEVLLYLYLSTFVSLS